MSERELAKKNLELSFEFSRYLLSHPELEERVPEDALVVFEVADDPALTAFNRALIQRTREPGQPLVVIRIKGLAPTRLVDPTVTVSA
jgi:hypothetical protein